MKSGRYARVMGDLWRSTRLEPLSFSARGLFLGVLSFCADQASDGTVSGKAMQKLTEGNPNGRRMIRNLVEHGFLGEQGDDFVVLSWAKYNISKAECDASGVGSAVGTVTGGVTRSAMNGPEQFRELSTPPLRPRTQDPRPIEKIDVREETASAKTSRQSGSKSSSSSSESLDVRRVFDGWVEHFWSGRGPRPKLTKDRRSKIHARLREGFTTEQLLEALRGATKSTFHLENGYTKLETLLKNAGTVEAHIARLHGGSSTGTRRQTIDDLPRASDGGIV